MKKLTIIIVTYNSQDIILTSLTKLNQQKYQIIIVDNGSSDNTVQIIKEKFSNVKIIKIKKNCGFARANNIALRKTSSDFSLILNPDAFIEEQDIEKIIMVMMEKNPQIALAGAMVYSCSLNRETNDLTNIKLCQISQKNLIKNKGSFHTAKFITGACMFMKMSVFQDIGFFDENFFLYCEDNEINKRTRKNGYDTVIINDTKFFHLSGQSSGVIDQQTRYLINWHKMGWSKMYYTQAVHNKFIAKLKSLRKIIQVSIKIMIDLIKYQKIDQSNQAMLSGSFAYLIGLEAFDKNDNPRRGIF